MLFRDVVKVTLVSIPGKVMHLPLCTTLLRVLTVAVATVDAGGKGKRSKAYTARRSDRCYAKSAQKSMNLGN